MNSLKIVDALNIHQDVLVALHEACFDKGWSAGLWRPILENPAACVYIVVDQAYREMMPIGFAAVQRVVDEAELLTIGVLPYYRKQGAAHLLLQSVITWAKASSATALHLEVAEDNAPARALYSRYNFKDVGYRPNYYQTTSGASGAVLMKLSV